MSWINTTYLGIDYPKNNNTTTAQLSLDCFRFYRLTRIDNNDDIRFIVIAGCTCGTNDTPLNGAGLRASQMYIRQLNPPFGHYLYNYLNHRGVSYNVTNIDNAIKRGFSSYTYEEISEDELLIGLLENYTSFHSDPVYVEATKLKYTDGTYNFARGVKTANEARQAAYNSLLKTYGSFYRATEKELSNAFAQSIE